MAWQDLEPETTEDLLEYMKWRDDPQFKAHSEDAFIAFCFRYREDVQRKARIIAANWRYDSTIADDIAEKTFERFYKYLSFKPDKCGQKDIHTCVKLYLYAFASRLLSDHKNAIENGNPFVGNEQIVRDLPDIEKMTIPAPRKAILQQKYDIINKALDRLSPKHRIVYLTYKQYEKELEEGFNLPKHLQAALRDELEITQTTIRGYKKEAFDKVNEYLQIYGTK